MVGKMCLTPDSTYGTIRTDGAGKPQGRNGRRTVGTYGILDGLSRGATFICRYRTSKLFYSRIAKLTAKYSLCEIGLVLVTR